MLTGVLLVAGCGGTSHDAAATGGTNGSVAGAGNGGAEQLGGAEPGGSPAGGDAPTGGTGGESSTGGVGGSQPISLTVSAEDNALSLAACSATPARFADVPAGDYGIQLAASTLSKGGVYLDPDTGVTLPSTDSYVIVNLPLPAGDPHENQRFFLLNGIGAVADVSLPASGSIDVYFIDSDTVSNSGQATVTLDPGSLSVSVDALTNLVAWREACASTPAQIGLAERAYRITLVSSTLSAIAGERDDYVLVRIPDAHQDNPHRYVMLSGVGSSFDFTPFKEQTLYAWFITSSAGSGQATLEISEI